MIVDIKGVGKAQFPDDMPIDDVREFLRNKYYKKNTQNSITLDPAIQTAQPYQPSLAEKAGGAIAEGLKSSGLISDNYGAQQIGKNITFLGEMLPGIGDATAGDEFGRAAAEGDKLGMALGALGVVPVVGDAAKQIAEINKFSDKVKIKRDARRSIYRLPTKGNLESIKHQTDLFDYSPQQLVDQLKVGDSTGIRQGGYYAKGEGLDTFYADDGTSKMIDPKTGNVVFDNDVEQTDNLIKNEILNLSEKQKTQAQRVQEFEQRKADNAEARAREEAMNETYKMQHTAPMRSDNPSGDNLTDVFGEDIYTANAVRYFGTGSDYDQKAINIIQAMRGNPERGVTIYRAVPKSVKSINPSDWVTTTKEYAQDHMEGEKGWHILSKKVKAKDIATDGNSIHEFGYDPE